MLIAVSTIGFVLSFVLAATDSGGGDNWTEILLKSGPWAIVVLLIILDKLTPVGERDRLRNENTELRKALQETEISNRKDVMPALIESNRLLALYRREPDPDAWGRRGKE